MILQHIKSRLVRPLFVLAVLVVFCDFIYAYYLFNFPKYEYKKNEKVMVFGKVRAKEYGDEGQIKKLIVGDTVCFAGKDAILIDPLLNSYVAVEGARGEINPPMNRGEFDMQKYYASEKIYNLVYADSIEVSKEPSFPYKERFLQLRRKIAESVSKECPLEGGTVNTLLLGDKTGLSEERKSLYMRVCVAHFLVISGLHVSAIGAAVYKFMGVCGLTRKPACFVSLMILLAYGLLTGFTVSVVRAVSMFAIRLLAYFINETYDMLNAVSLTVILAIISNPLSILGSSFIYSYSTVFSIAFYVTYIHPKAYRKIGIWGHLREALRMPFVIFLFIFPVSLLLSFEYSLACIPLNAVLAPLSGIILCVSFLALLFSALHFPLAAFLADYLLSGILYGFDYVCNIMDGLDFLDFLGRPQTYQVIVYYVLLIAFLFALRKHGGQAIKAILILSMLAFLNVNTLHYPIISMLYVGQGECIFIKTGTKTGIMIDCGSSDEKSVAQYKVLPFLKSEGINEIQDIYVSHSDSDHIGEVSALIDECKKEGIKIKRLIMPDVDSKIKNDSYYLTCMAAKEQKIPVIYMKEGMEVKYKGFTIKCIWPGNRFESFDINDNSMVLLYECNGFSSIFMGDATAASEREIVKRNNYEALAGVNLLKVGHHGSATSSTEEFIDYINPGYGIISAGINNRYGHPDKGVTDRLNKKDIPWKCTKDYGQLDVYIYKNRFAVKSFIN